MSDYIREVREKVGNMPLVVSVAGCLIRQHVTYPNGDEVYFVNLIFECRNFEGTMKVNDHESRELKFFASDSLPPLTASNEPIVATYFG
ncbi:hypothetical protein LC065_17875 [Halobacillus litoralis]|uniref:hypothetical protein n=1 Tax=Halobacillus litoralis TaxID=45668 RepID=UPI001CFE519B|nr:hypothetical protein [Halobacillus litoralis]WLR47359.1 hypothetical protein LC065_17875 [Halobacillus litoralis]